MRLASWLLLCSSAAISSANENSYETPFDGFVVEDEDADRFSTPVETQRCCTDADPIDILVVSTMDGKMQALDVANGGRLLWKSDLDGAALLGGNLGEIEPLRTDNDRFLLVPSLDGSLYMFSDKHRVLEPIPLTAEMLLQSVRIGKEAVAGGKSITTTGVDPATGKIRYHCTSAYCEQAVQGEQPVSTIVFRRVSHHIRAVDALNGTEKWNLSVSEYDATLVRQHSSLNDNETARNHYRFMISPPKGTITAIDSFGHARWTVSLGVHIARSWHLDGFNLSEVSLFDSNIHSIGDVRNDARTLRLPDALKADAHAVLRPESLFYLGTNENGLFILCSDKLRNKMKQISKRIEHGAQSGSPLDHDSKALVKAGGEAYQVTDGVLDDVLGQAFSKSIARMKERQSVRKITGPEEEEDDVEMTIALPAPDDVGSSSNSCDVPDEGVLMIGEENIRNAEPSGGDEQGDQGWFILRPRRSPLKPLHFITQSPSTCATQFVKKSLHLENDVNPLWRLLAIFLLFITGFLSMFRLTKIRRSWRAARDAFDGEVLVADESEPRIAPLSVTAPLKVSPVTPSEHPAPVRKVASDDVLVASAAAKDEREMEEAARKRNMSNRSGSHSSANENFESTFLRDYTPVRVLGRGGFGVVFEAMNKLDQCSYAVKRIAVVNNERAIDRVLREVRAMAMLDHPGIIRYCTTWLERPPEGWQKATDKEMLDLMKRGRIDLPEAIDSSASSVEEATRTKNDESSLGVVAPLACRSDADDSWADEGGDSAESEASTSSSSSSDDDEQQIPLNDKPGAMSQDNSDSIVFDRNSENRKSGGASQKSSMVSQLDTDLALVTSIDEELLPSRNTTDNVYLYIQMQLCQDKTLYAWLLANKGIESRVEERMRRWMKQLVAAVYYIHDKGLIHRDIKPQNIFVFEGSDTLKIGDLGLVSKGASEGASEEARRKSSAHSSLHTDNVGTRSYMSPEQLANNPYTSKVDVFSLGLIFSELCIPFQTLMERSKVLSDLQAGIQPEQLSNKKELAEFVAWLTKVEPLERPTCKDIMQCPFLA